MKRFCAFIGGLMLVCLAFASPANATPSPSPQPTSCSVNGQPGFPSQGGCILYEKPGSGGAGAIATTPTKHTVRKHGVGRKSSRRELPLTGTSFPMIPIFLLGAGLIISGIGSYRLGRPTR